MALNSRDALQHVLLRRAHAAPGVRRAAHPELIGELFSFNTEPGT
jgi:hypothetical protein